MDLKDFGQARNGVLSDLDRQAENMFPFTWLKFKVQIKTNH